VILRPCIPKDLLFKGLTSLSMAYILNNVKKLKNFMVKLLIIDIDGVMTSGRKIYGPQGEVAYKEFNDRDFTAIKRFKASKVEVVFLSGDRKINQKMAENRKTKFYHSMVNDVLEKEPFVAIFEKEYSVSAAEMAYIGDDLFDISIMKKVGFPCCPNDAIKDVKDICAKVLAQNGGDGVLAELYEFLLENKMIGAATMERIKELDANEKY